MPEPAASLSETDFDLDLSCSSCNADLTNDELYASHRFCSACNRHFWIPARARIEVLVDPDSFVETSVTLVSLDPLLFHDRLSVSDRLAEAREQSAISEAVITGSATIGGSSVVLATLDLAVFGAGLGILASEKIALACDFAAERSEPLLLITSGDSARSKEGVLTFAQVTKLTAAISQIRRAGVAVIALMTHPTNGPLLLALANQADISFIEPGTDANLSADLVSRARAGATDLASAGLVDGVLDRSSQRDTLSRLLYLLNHHGAPDSASPNHRHVAKASLRAEQELALSDLPDRPSAAAYLPLLFDNFVELHGDLRGADPAGTRIGLGRLDGRSVAVCGFDRNSGSQSAAAWSKANRLLRLAAHLEMPCVLLLDPGREPASVDDVATARALADSISLLTAIPVPVISVVLGSLASLNGVELMFGDRVVMQEHAVILSAGGEPIATAHDCHRLGLIQFVASEPSPSAASNPAEAAELLRAVLRDALVSVNSVSSGRLLAARARRLRRMGLGTAESRELARVEWRELEDLQRAIGRSWDELRQRVEQRTKSLPSWHDRASWPQLSGLASRSSITLPKFNLHRPALTELAQRVSSTRRSAQRGSTTVTEDTDGFE